MCRRSVVRGTHLSAVSLCRKSKSADIKCSLENKKPTTLVPMDRVVPQLYLMQILIVASAHLRRRDWQLPSAESKALFITSALL